MLVASSSACVDGGTASDDDAIATGDRKRVFLFRNGTLGKIRDSTDTRAAVDVADEDCTDGASRMSLGGTWRAWLSSSAVDAIDRIADVGPWYRVDRETTLFASKADLARGPRARIDPSEESEDWESCMRFGQCSQTFWSGTTVDGRRAADNCLDWTVYNLPAVATVGRADVSGEEWVATESLACAAYLALLCIEQ